MIRARLSVAIVAAAIAATTVLAAPPASASVGASVSGTGGEGLFVRPGPSQDSGAPLRLLAEGTAVRLDCWVHGQTIEGYWYTGDYWHHISSPVAGYVTDTYIYAGVNGPAPGEPPCSTSPPSTAGPGKPSGAIAAPAPASSPRARNRANTSGSALKTQFQSLMTLCSAAGWHNCVNNGLHYLDRSGSARTVSMPDLLWRERPVWGSLEWQLRYNAQIAYRRATGTSARSSSTVGFDTGWYGYNATGRTDWHFALGHFSIRLKGDVWIGPAGADGVRPVQLRYRVFLYDVYDFGPGGEFGQFRALHDQGRAAEFLVTGSGSTITKQFTSSTFAPGSLGLNW